MNPDNNTKEIRTSYKEAYMAGKHKLGRAGVPEADLDAWYLLEFVTEISRAAFYADPEKKMDPVSLRRYEELLSLREKRIPLQHITGEQEFMGLTFQVNKDVLIPRQDTETLVEEALSLIKKKKPYDSGSELRILDLCTGSGCILLSIMYHAGETICGTGADISEKALCVAQNNAERLGINARFIQGDLFENISGSFDMILSNPPYIKSGEIDMLQEEVKLFDPRAALDGKEDGLFFYREIAAQAKEYLNPGGMLIFEIGHDQGESVPTILEAEGYSEIWVKKDLAGLDRVVCSVYS